MHNESPTLDRSAPTPIFRQLATWMREQVSTGAWRRGDQLPMEITLAEQLNVARGTLRKAVDQLIDEGLLVRVRGRGTFIAHDIVRSPLTSSLTTLAEELEQRGIDYTTRVLTQEVIPAPPPIAVALGVEGSIFHLRRMRGDGEGSITLLDNWVVLPPLCAERAILVKQDYAENSLFGTLESDLGIALSHGSRTISAIGADRNLARILGVPHRFPLIDMKQVTYDASDRPVETSRIWIRPDRLRIHSIVHRAPLPS